MIGGGTTVSPNRTGTKDIISPRGSIGTQEVREAQPFHTSINGIYAKLRDPVPTWSKVFGLKSSNESSSAVYVRGHMNLTCDAVLT